MELGVWEVLGFADYESGRREGGSVTDSHFGFIINLLSSINVINWLYY